MDIHLAKSNDPNSIDIPLLELRGYRYLTGREVCLLMRRHKVTIKELSERFDVPLKRIRHVRSNGTSGVGFVLDWIEAITGTLPRNWHWYLSTQVTKHRNA